MYLFYNAPLLDFLPFLIVCIITTSTYIGVEGGWWVTAKLINFQGKTTCPITLEMSQWIAKLMAYIMNKIN